MRTDLPREVAALVDAALDHFPGTRKISAGEMEQWLSKAAPAAKGKAELREKVASLRADAGAKDAEPPPPSSRRRIATTGSPYQGVRFGPAPASRGAAAARRPSVPAPAPAPAPAPLHLPPPPPEAAPIRFGAPPEPKPEGPTLPSRALVAAPTVAPVEPIAEPPPISATPISASPISAVPASVAPAVALPAPALTPPAPRQPCARWRRRWPSRRRPRRRRSSLPPCPSASGRRPVFHAGAGVGPLRPASGTTAAAPRGAALVAHHRARAPIALGDGGHRGLGDHGDGGGERGDLLLRGPRQELFPIRWGDQRGGRGHGRARGQPAVPASPAPSASAGPVNPAESAVRVRLPDRGSPATANVFVSGKLAGPVNKPLKVRCGRWFIRLATTQEGRYPDWVSPGETVLVACQDSTRIEMNPRRP